MTQHIKKHFVNLKNDLTPKHAVVGKQFHLSEKHGNDNMIGGN